MMKGVRGGEVLVNTPFVKVSIIEEHAHHRSLVKHHQKIRDTRSSVLDQNGRAARLKTQLAHNRMIKSSRRDARDIEIARHNKLLVGHMMEIENKANKLNPSYRPVSAVKVNRARQREAHRIDIENKGMASRLLQPRGKYDSRQWNADYEAHVARRNMLSRRISVPLPPTDLPLSSSMSSPRLAAAHSSQHSNNNSRPVSARPSVQRRMNAQRELDMIMAQSAAHNIDPTASDEHNDDHVHDGHTATSMAAPLSSTTSTVTNDATTTTSTAATSSSPSSTTPSGDQFESPREARQRLRPTSAHANSFVFSPRIARIYGVSVPAPPAAAPPSSSSSSSGSSTARYHRNVRSADPRLRSSPSSSSTSRSARGSAPSVAFEDTQQGHDGMERSSSRISRPHGGRPVSAMPSSSRRYHDAPPTAPAPSWQRALTSLEEEAVVQGMILDDDGNYVNTHPRYAYAPEWHHATNNPHGTTATRGGASRAGMRDADRNADAEVAYYNQLAHEAARDYPAMDPYTRAMRPISATTSTGEFYPRTRGAASSASSSVAPSSTYARTRQRVRSEDMPDPEFLIKLDDEYIVKE